MIGIWKDTYYTTEGETLTFSIEITERKKVGDGYEDVNITIFNGKAWGKPSDNTIAINLNNYCRGYLKTSIPDLDALRGEIWAGNVYHTHDNAVKEFTILNANDAVLGKYKFIYDWSYKDSDYNIRPHILSRPVNGKAVDGMFLFYTYLDIDDKVKSIITNTPYKLNNAAKAQVYTEVEGCRKKYALYYVNRYGGIDSFLIEGKTTKKDSYNPYFITSTYNNNTLEFGKKIYHNDITTTYELNTGWMKDAESENLAFNLFSSNNIYLHDLVEDKIMPVVITNTETTYKTFKNQNNKLYNYTINVECSQKEQRL